MDEPMNIPKIKREWTIGTVLASLGSLSSIIIVLGSMWWMAAGYAGKADQVPAISAQVQKNKEAIAVMRNQQANNHQQYEQILDQLDHLNAKIDHMAEGRR